MIAPVNHIVGLTSIVRERVLPVSGNVIARVNQRVGATDVIAETRWAREHIFLDVARDISFLGRLKQLHPLLFWHSARQS